jgi:hypothetical protein
MPQVGSLLARNWCGSPPEHHQKVSACYGNTCLAGGRLVVVQVSLERQEKQNFCGSLFLVGGCTHACRFAAHYPCCSKTSCRVHCFTLQSLLPFSIHGRSALPSSASTATCEQQQQQSHCVVRHVTIDTQGSAAHNKTINSANHVVKQRRLLRTQTAHC